ncbi:hypothetical protein KCP74_11420 [Salmonella enterica subsp. enterica]|nr:hypothetical protein KCP74_11420 [Salmonella enterica subsp. enterica]
MQHAAPTRFRVVGGDLKSIEIPYLCSQFECLIPSTSQTIPYGSQHDVRRFNARFIASILLEYADQTSVADRFRCARKAAMENAWFKFEDGGRGIAVLGGSQRMRSEQGFSSILPVVMAGRLRLECRHPSGHD